MFINMSAEKATPTNCRLAGDSGVGGDKAERLSAAIKQDFQQHQAKLGSKTLMSIAFCIRSK